MAQGIRASSSGEHVGFVGLQERSPGANTEKTALPPEPTNELVPGQHCSGDTMEDIGKGSP